MRYYVLKEQGGNVCESCHEWEQTVNADGGYEFGPEDVQKALNPGFQGRTDLFHTMCRCTLMPSPDGIPIKTPLDKKILLAGALGHLYLGDRPQEERIEMMRKYE